ncbi:hypothetical protein F5148DRAFT_1247906 [Russula earlei]|uniref:Uncharacterized protein n=1 Tax=Russula earlei TaxID=71964 RepID=A0ACC0TU62_9AGAM|nr:hypothetical protein F5148DRAFT_1247906 [Russula earlei]
MRISTVFTIICLTVSVAPVTMPRTSREPGTSKPGTTRHSPMDVDDPRTHLGTTDITMASPSPPGAPETTTPIGESSHKMEED